MNEEREDAVAKLVRLAGARPKPDAARTARVRGAVYEEWQRATRRSRVVRYGRLGIGAAAIAATLAAVLILRPQTQTIDIPAGAATSMNWNGATVRLESGTRWTIQSPTEATLEAGAIYFSSKGRAGVTINTPFGVVRDIGTKFEIRLSEAEMRVRVDEGAVEVRGTRGGAGTELIATHDAVTTRSTAPMMITLEGQTLGAVIEQAAREKGLRVRWETDRDVILHGNVPLTPQEAIDAATAASGVVYRIDGDTLVVSRKK